MMKQVFCLLLAITVGNLAVRKSSALSLDSGVSNQKGLENINGSWYHITPNGVYYTVYTGSRFCKDKNKKLISFDSAEKEYLIMRFLEDNSYIMHYWTSGVRVDEDSFMWSGTGQPVSGYTNWDLEDKEPDGNMTTGGCIMYHRTNNQWWDYDCAASYGVICEE